MRNIICCFYDVESRGERRHEIRRVYGERKSENMGLKIAIEGVNIIKVYYIHI